MHQTWFSRQWRLRGAALWIGFSGLLAALPMGGCRSDADAGQPMAEAAPTEGLVADGSVATNAAAAADFRQGGARDADVTGRWQDPSQPRSVAEGAYPARTPPVPDAMLAAEMERWDQAQRQAGGEGQPLPPGMPPEHIFTPSAPVDPRLLGPFPEDASGREVPPQQ